MVYVFKQTRLPHKTQHRNSKWHNMLVQFCNSGVGCANVTDCSHGVNGRKVHYINSIARKHNLKCKLVVRNQQGYLCTLYYLGENHY